MPWCVKIGSVVFLVEDGKKEKERYKKSRKRYFTYSWGSPPPRKRIFTKFCTSGDMSDVIVFANFGVEKFRGFGNTRGEILEFLIETTGHPYNSAALLRSL